MKSLARGVIGSLVVAYQLMSAVPSTLRDVLSFLFTSTTQSGAMSPRSVARSVTKAAGLCQQIAGWSTTYQRFWISWRKIIIEKGV
ncbi:unnamed protein product [Nezara viridula]|uniref:Uncharacterized protein n=1 Tax=Nezara viridula TaxID=85310 RepID=A0A9P0H1U6_NEZVI|nr:unnamed protein product [Nezara viridula]